MADSNSKSIAAEGYRQAAISVQKLDGETFIQTNVFPKDGAIILDLSVGFEITRSVQTECVELVFEYVEELLKWHWSTTHGVFDTFFVTEERLQTYLAPYTDGNGKPCLDFRGMKHEMPVCQLVAIKKSSAERA